MTNSVHAFRIVAIVPPPALPLSVDSYTADFAVFNLSKTDPRYNVEDDYAQFDLNNLFVSSTSAAMHDKHEFTWPRERAGPFFCNPLQVQNFGYFGEFLPIGHMICLDGHVHSAGIPI